MSTQHLSRQTDTFFSFNQLCQVQLFIEPLRPHLSCLVFDAGSFFSHTYTSETYTVPHSVHWTIKHEYGLDTHRKHV